MARPKATLYLRHDVGYEKVDFSKGKPIVPSDYKGAFHVRFTEDGKRKWASFPALDEALAHRDRLTISFDRKREGLPPLPVIPVAKSEDGKLTIADAVNQFVAECQNRIQDWRNGGVNGLSPRSADIYRKAVQDFAASCLDFGATDMSEIADPERGAAILAHFKTWLNKNVMRRGGKAAYTDQKKFTILGQFLAGHRIKMAQDRRVNPDDKGLLKRNAVPRVKKPKAIDVVYYTPDDIKAMLSACATVDYKRNNNKSIYNPEDLRDLLLVFLWTGMRDEEVQHLEWDDINGDILVQDKPKWDWRVKDGEKRKIKVSPKLRALLEARKTRTASKHWIEAHPGHSKTLVFSNTEGTPNQNFADHIGGLQERAILGEVERKNPTERNRKPYRFSRPECLRHILHNLRHTYATMLGVQGQPARNIQYALGHSNLETTERYLALVDNPEEVRAAFEAIG